MIRTARSEAISGGYTAGYGRFFAVPNAGNVSVFPAFYSTFFYIRFFLFHFFLYVFFDKIDPVKDCRFEIAGNRRNQFLLGIDINNISAIADRRIGALVFIKDPP